MSSTQVKRGFTLIELLVVIAIIGVLSSVVLVSLDSARMRARDTKRIAEVHNLQKAVEMYYTDHGEYPGESGYYYTNQGGDWFIRRYAGSGSSSEEAKKFQEDLSPYMGRLPEAIHMSQMAYINEAGECKFQDGRSVLTRIQYRRHGETGYKISVRLEADCNRVLNDGGTSTCCPSAAAVGSRGRSYETYEVFTSGLESLSPYW